jgi:hypothetical protein
VAPNPEFDLFALKNFHQRLRVSAGALCETQIASFAKDVDAQRGRVQRDPCTRGLRWSGRSQEARTAYTHHVRGYLIGLSRALAGRSEGADGDAYMTLAAMVGALVLARSVNDPTLYDELLSQTARALRRIAGS